MNQIRTIMCLVSLCVLAVPAMSFGQVRQIPIGDFVNAQTGYIAWADPVTDRYLLFDLYGKIDQYFDLDLETTVKGRVTMRVLDDGRAHVSVLVETRDAMCWGTQSLDTMAFGYNPYEVLFSGLTPSAGNGMFAFEFTLPSPDIPLDDWWLYFWGIEDSWDSAIGIINCRGELRAGSGFPEGKPGFARTTQRDLNGATGVPSGCPATDCYPTERIDFKPIGQ